jgi:hypothetical protein
VAAGRQGLRLFEIVHGPRPKQVAVVESLSSASHLIAGEEVMVVSNGGFGAQIVDLVGDGAPRVIATFRLPRSLPVGRGRIDADGVLFVAADLGGLAVVDLRAPAEPRVLVPRGRKMKINFQD